MLVPMNDTTVDVKDAIVLHVHNASDNTKNVRFFWSFDKGASFRDSTVDTVMVHRFSLLDTGNNMVSVKAVDQRGKTTGPVSFAIIVKAYRPSISSQEEVVASIGDSLAFRANAYDSNGTIVAYFWAIDGNDFSLVTPTGLLSWPWGFYQAGTHVVNVKALDDDSLFSPVVTTRVIVAPNAPLQNPGLQLQQANLARAVKGIRTAGGFGEPKQWQYEWQREYTRDEWLDHLLTTGTLTLLAPDQLATVAKAVGTAIDSIGGSFTMDYVTLAIFSTAKV